jgi:hypothetical protein
MHIPEGKIGELAHGVHGAVEVVVPLKEAVATPLMQKLQRQILVISPDEDHLILRHQIQDKCLHFLRFGAPVKKVAANDQLVGFGIVEKALFGQYGLQFGKKGMYVGNYIVFDKAHSLVAV